MHDSTEIGRLLSAIDSGEGSAVAQLMPVLYSELRRLAARQMRRERRSHTWQTTELVHEAYLRLVGPTVPNVRSREHFMALAAEAVRRVLVDHARRRAADARGGSWRRITLEAGDQGQDTEEVDLLALQSSLEELHELDERQARVVEMRFFGGMSIAETAAVLDVSPRTVTGDWYMARAFLRRRLSSSGDAP